MAILSLTERFLHSDISPPQGRGREVAPWTFHPFHCLFKLICIRPTYLAQKMPTKYAQREQRKNTLNGEQSFTLNGEDLISGMAGWCINVFTTNAPELRGKSL